MVERFVVTLRQAGERADKALARLLPDVSRATIQRWVDEQRVTRNGRPCRARDKLSVGDELTVEPGPAPPSRALPDASVEIDVVHEDAELLVVNKPAGLVVHPGRGHATGTLVNGLLAREHSGELPADPLDPEGAMRPGIVHRIDKDTSGLLVIAKTVVAREKLKEQLALHTMQRVYQAITLGVPEPGRIETQHGRHPSARLKFTSHLKGGRRAVSSLSVVERLARGAAALVECRLETGRTHQIRVHLAEQRACPILADELYGKRPAAPDLCRIAEQLGRQALHAAVLGFEHPRTGRLQVFRAELPADMQQALGALRNIA